MHLGSMHFLSTIQIHLLKLRQFAAFNNGDGAKICKRNDLKANGISRGLKNYPLNQFSQIKLIFSRQFFFRLLPFIDCGMFKDVSFLVKLSMNGYK